MSNEPLPSSFDGNTDFYEENRWQKLFRRLKEEPLIPLGIGLTSWALYNASKSIRAGDPVRTNRMFRARIYAQGFTIAAMVAGSMYWKTDREKRKEFEGVVSERKAQEKRDAWIRELEARDQEEKDLKAARAKKGLKRGIEKVERVVEKAVGKEGVEIRDEKVGSEKGGEGGKEPSQGILAIVGNMFGGKK